MSLRALLEALEAKTACDHHDSEAECSGEDCLRLSCHVEDVYYLLPQARAAAAVVEAARHAMGIGGVLHANGCHFTRPGASCNCGYAALDEALRSLTSSLTQEER